MGPPVILAVDPDPETLAGIERELRDRYERHYRVICVGSSAEARERLVELEASGEPLALVLAGGGPDEDPDALFAEIRRANPQTKRAMLIGWGQWGYRDAGATILPYTHIDGGSLGASVGARAIVGPYSRLRGGAVLGADVHVGNFVEIKNSTLGDGAKANHLAYLGDSDVGARVNYGAGSITANYDGANKHRTTIEADAHIGSNCVLVAPVVIGAGATIGGGSTINKDAPAGELTVARARQATVRGWKRPVKR